MNACIIDRCSGVKQIDIFGERENGAAWNYSKHNEKFKTFLCSVFVFWLFCFFFYFSFGFWHFSCFRRVLDLQHSEIEKSARHSGICSYFVGINDFRVTTTHNVHKMLCFLRFRSFVVVFIIYFWCDWSCCRYLCCCAGVCLFILCLAKVARLHCSD